MTYLPMLTKIFQRECQVDLCISQLRLDRDRRVQVRPCRGEQRIHQRLFQSAAEVVTGQAISRVV